MSKQLLPLVALLAACAPVYSKPALNAPLFKQAGDIQIGAYAGVNGADVSVAGAPTDFLGIVAAGSLDYEGDNQHRYAEAGLAWYLPFGHFDRGRFELIAGGGGGLSEGEGIDLFGNTIRASGRYGLGFLQTDIGFGWKYIDAGFCGRASYLHYDFDAGGTTADVVFLEPAGFVRGGYRFIKAEVQIGGVFPVGDVQGLDWVPLHLSVGVRFNLGELLFDFYAEERAAKRQRAEEHEEDYDEEEYYEEEYYD